MNMRRCLSLLSSPASISFVAKAIARISRISEELKLISVIRCSTSAARAGAVDQGIDRGIAEIAAVPVMLAVDLDRLEIGRQAGRRQYRLGREVRRLEHLQLAGAHIGGVEEELRRLWRLIEPLEIHHALQQRAQRI